MSALPFKHAVSALALFACIAATPVVLAHAHLESSLPAAGSDAPSPKELRLTFSEGVEEKFSKVSICFFNAAATTEIIAAQNIATDPADKKILIVTPAVPLAPGAYKIEWHAVSVDTHKSEGVYRFKVTP